MDGLALLLSAAAAAYGIAHWLGLPAVPVLLGAGLLLTFVAPIPPDLLNEALVLGAAFLLFATGLELNPRSTRTERRLVLRVGMLQFVLLALVGLGAALALGFPLIGSLYLALALTASSTLVVVRLLQRRGQLFEPFARLVVGVLLLQDLGVLLFIPVITFLPRGLLAVATGLAATLALIALAWAMHRWVAPLVLRTDDQERVLLGVLTVLFVFLGLSDTVGLPLVTGAFLGGVALSRFPVNSAIRPQLASVADFFSALFYLALGALIALPTRSELLQAIALAALVVVITPPLVALIAERNGFSARPALEAGLLLAQTSEISLVVGLYGLTAGQIDAGLFRVIALVTLITMVLTPFITTDALVWRLLRLHPMRAQVSAAIPEHGHILLLGSGATGMPLLETLLSYGHEVVVVDDDPVVIERLRQADVPCIRGDASDLEVLRKAHADTARIISSTIRRPQDNRRLLEFARGVPVLVRVFNDRDAGWIREAGGIPIVYAEAAADEMMRWFDANFPSREVEGAAVPPTTAPARGLPESRDR